MVKLKFTSAEAQSLATELAVDFEKLGCDLEQLRAGLDVELEHGLINRDTNVTGDNAILTAKIALAHLNEFPDYYTRLEVLEREAATALKEKADG